MAFLHKDADVCVNRFRDLREEFEPNLSMLRYRLSSSANEGVNAYLKACREGRRKPHPKLVADKIKRYGIEDRIPLDADLWSFGSALQEYIEFDTESLEDVERIGRLMSEDSMFMHFTPPYFGYSDVEFIETPFWFVHFTSKDNALSIEREGFLGREDTEALYSTKHGMQSSVEEDGYIFGYLLEAYSQEDALDEVYRNFESYEPDPYDDDALEFPYYAVSPHYIVAKAEFGVDAHHMMDNERQTIIPTKCIDNESIASTTLPAHFQVYEDDLFDL